MTSIVLITGASRGIGAATAVLAAQHGWDVAVNYSSNEAAAQAVVQAVQALGRRAIAVQADVADEGQVLAMFARVDSELGRTTGLVNNAGVVDRAQRLQDMDMARWRRMFDINVLGSFLCAREAVRRMSTAEGGAGGSIVNVSSRAACLGSAHQYVDYAASKAAIDTMTLGLAHEVAAQGIRVNGVRPGLIETDIHASGGQPDRVQRLSAGVPLGRGGTADEIAQAIYWLMSEHSSYCTGSFIDAGGGR
jgi:NAD(P)-dependent dehydrogenase (short-subunit alcohol dehydrogenase family)